MHQPRGMSRTVTLCLQFPIVTTTLWGQLAGKTMTVLPRSLLLYFTVMFVYVYQTPTFPPHCGGNVKVKTQHIDQAMDIPVLLRGWGEAVVTNDWCIIYSLQCTSHENLVLNHKIWHPLIYCSTYFQAHSHPITSFSFRPQHYFQWMSSFSRESHLTGEPCDYFLLSFIITRNYVLACIFCIVWCQQISIWNKQIEFNLFIK